MTHSPYLPGALVRFRDRDWVVLPQSDAELLQLRALGGAESEPTYVYLPVERVLGQAPVPAGFPPPSPAAPGNYLEAQLLRDALLLELRNGAGPFRSFGQIAIEPRPYQLAPLLLAFRHPVARLLIADDVGVGKTIEACLIARELLDRGEIRQICVLCPPHLCDQWRDELRQHFNLDAVVVRAGTVAALERQHPGTSLFEVHAVTVVSLDYIKADKRRDDFAHHCPDFVIVDEAHTCVRKGQGRQQRFELLRHLATRAERHLVLLTATPHSGDTAAFYNLLSLLDPEFRQLDQMPPGPERDRLRERVREHFIQRGRDDIDQWSENRLFPQRVSRDGTYQLHPEYAQLLEEVRTYASELLTHSRRPRLDWWTALALLRCISSSPAAAETALRRAQSQDSDAGPGFEEQARATLMDGDLDGDGDPFDDAPPPVLDPHDAKRLERFARLARDLRGPEYDRKLALLIEELRVLLKEGFHPVVFCRYLRTADYLVEHLATAFPELRLRVVTGALAPESREQIVAELEPGRDLLVATDCLSEGVNLQAKCNAVLHYDLAWNPNRHEQRIGRVDRFGQSAPQVRSVLIYGADNPIDGAVLRVILDKAQQIQRELGVRVPLPRDERGAANAILRAVLMRQGGPRQQAFDFLGEDDLDEAALEQAWREAAAQHGSRGGYLFANKRIRYADVASELDKAREALGGPAETERFVRAAAARLGVPGEPLEPGCFRFPWSQLQDPALLERLRYARLDGLHRVCFHFPPAPGHTYLHRAHPLCHLLADHLAERTLEQANSREAQPLPGALARASAIYSDRVPALTTLYLLRLRLQLGLRGRDRQLLAEEALVLCDDGDQVRRLTPAESVALLDLRPSRNIDRAVQTRFLDRALARCDQPDWPALLQAVIAEREQALAADHQALRRAHGRTGQTQVAAHPPDLIGVYVLVPDLSAGAVS